MLKIIIIGDSQTGKTQIIQRFLKETFDQNFKAKTPVNIDTYQVTGTEYFYTCACIFSRFSEMECRILGYIR